MVKVQSRSLTLTKGAGEKLQEESRCEAGRVRPSVLLMSVAKRMVLALLLKER